MVANVVPSNVSHAVVTAGDCGAGKPDIITAAVCKPVSAPPSCGAFVVPTSVQVDPSYVKDSVVSPAATSPAVCVHAPATSVLSIPVPRLPPAVQFVPSYSKV